VARRDSGEHPPLAERATELDALERCREAVEQGWGRTVLIEGADGTGKTRLLHEMRARADFAGWRIFAAAGNELEREFPFGVAVQLFEAFWAAAGPTERAIIGSGPGHLAGGLMNGHMDVGSPPRSDQAYPVIHSLVWFVRNIVSPDGSGSARRPLAILIDDGHWADDPSLRFLVYLAARLERLPIALVVALRPRRRISDTPTYAALRSSASSDILRLDPLGRAGADAMIRSEFSDPDEAFVSSCYAVTRGNPFLLTELLSDVRNKRQPPDAKTAVKLTDCVPDAVTTAVSMMLERMSADERAVASAVAVLGDRQPLTAIAHVAEVDLRTTTEIADTLADADVLTPGAPVSFVYPVVRAAVLDAISPLARGQTHRRAAMIIREQGAESAAVAEHLLAAPPESDPNAVDALRVAAQEDIDAGNASGAVRLLSRALEEQPPATLYPAVVAELGHAEARAGLPQASERLQEAIGVTDDPARRAELALTRGKILLEQNNAREAAAVFDSGRRELGGSTEPLADDLEAAHVWAASLVPELADDALQRCRKMVEQLAGTPSPTQCIALAHTAMLDGLRGQTRAEARHLAELAWSNGRILQDEHGSDTGLASLTAALLFMDDLERVLEICETIGADSEERSARIPPATIGSLRAWPRYERGQIDEAAADAQIALDAADPGPRIGRTAYGALACCMLMRGQLEQAEQALALVGDGDLETGIHHPFLMEVRAQVRLAQRRPEEALEDALQAGHALKSDFGVMNPGASAWRSTAALAHLAMGHSDPAEELAADELRLAQASGLTRVVIRDLRVLGLAVRGSAGVELLEEAVRTAEHAPARLEGMLALADLGVMLRREKKRAAAREPLRRALELSHRGGATAIAERARMELGATGSRPRRMNFSGVESLTPAERRVADLAAERMTTRMIAQALVITPKTVEYHLRHIYQKLGIGSRDELTAAIQGER
jgi:DNA-binding CsgD family transcriptional regulator/predicted negative regulator of RcsB-dependent stress response